MTPQVTPEALQTVAGLVEVVLRDMRAKLGPSWPPNWVSGQQVTEWRDILGPIPETLRALAAPQATPQGWQDIATAPKDGTRVLVHIGSAFEPLIARWDDGAEAWMDDEPFAPDPQPILWQPLPSPPEATS